MEPSGTPPPASARARANGVTAAVGFIVRRPEFAVAVVVLAVIAVTTVRRHTFLASGDSRRDLLVTPAMLILLAIGQTVVIITRSVDLSVGSTLGLTAYLTGRIFVDFGGIPWFLVFFIAMAFGAALGLINGVLVAFGRVPALVITLGTMYVYRGVFLTWAGSDRIVASDIPPGFNTLGTRSVLGIPVLMLLALAVLAVVAHYLHTSRGGRELYAIGSDPDAAVLYGLPVKRRVLGAFVVSGALAGLAGVFYVARYGTVSSGAGFGLELEAVGAAVIGGVAIFGGSGTVLGAAIGAFLLDTVNRALPVLGIGSFWHRAVVGSLILTAVVLDRLLALRRQRLLAAERGHA